MKTLEAVVCAVVFCAGFVGCASPKMTSWVGHNQSELIAHWGPPQSTTSDGNGGKILIYQSQVNHGPPVGQLVPNLHGGYDYIVPQKGYNQSRMYYVDSKGTIYNYRWQGL